MEKFNIPYSLKNIPIPSKNSYKIKLVEQVEKFLTRLRWKMFFIKNPQTTKSDKQTFGFNTEVTAPYSAELKLFEDDLLELTANVKYKPVRNDFQNNLTKDIKKIDESKEVIVEADKTGNLYKVNPSH